MIRPALLAGLLAAALGGCSSSQDVLDPSAIKPPPAASNVAAPDTAPLPSTNPQVSAAAEAPSTVSASQARVQFAPVVGPTVEAATALSERLVSRSRETGIGLARNGGPAPTHLIRGYFSALKEGKNVTVVYVWDVYDPAGNRIHRISGQERAVAEAGAEWEAVPAQTMQKVADMTVDQLAAWLDGRKGG